jgi:hypothetical protein
MCSQSACVLGELKWSCGSSRAKASAQGVGSKADAFHKATEGAKMRVKRERQGAAQRGVTQEVQQAGAAVRRRRTATQAHASVGAAFCSPLGTTAQHLVLARGAAFVSPTTHASAGAAIRRPLNEHVKGER